MGNPQDVIAWFQLASLIGDPAREKFCLEQVLKIDPQHAAAQARLAEISHIESQNTTAEESLPNNPTSLPSQTWHEARCPHVGLLDDPESLAAFPSGMNHCYRLKQPKPIKLDHQRQFCLSLAHKRCPVYQRVEEALANSKDKTALQPAQGKAAVNRSST